MPISHTWWAAHTFTFLANNLYSLGNFAKTRIKCFSESSELCAEWWLHALFLIHPTLNETYIFVPGTDWQRTGERKRGKGGREGWGWPGEHRERRDRFRPGRTRTARRPRSGRSAVPASLTFRAFLPVSKVECSLNCYPSKDSAVFKWRENSTFCFVHDNMEIGSRVLGREGRSAWKMSGHRTDEVSLMNMILEARRRYSLSKLPWRRRLAPRNLF